MVDDNGCFYKCQKWIPYIETVREEVFKILNKPFLASMLKSLYKHATYTPLHTHQKTVKSYRFGLSPMSCPLPAPPTIPVTNSGIPEKY